MSTAQIEKRLRELEGEVARLKARIDGKGQAPKTGWRSIVGTFAGDPLHAEAMKLGQQYRRSLRPKRRKGK